MAKLLNHFGDIKNEAKCLSALKALVPDFNRNSPAQIIASVNKKAMSKNDIRYFDFDYVELNENEAGKQIQWVNTGYFSGTQPIYAQFTGGSYNWTGALIGTEETIRELQSQTNSEPKTAVEKRKSLEKELCVNLNSLEIGEVFTDDEDSKVITRINKNEAFLNALYGKLLAPNSWTTAQLDNYINLCIVRLNHYLEKNKDYSDFIIFNEDKSLALINSGLLDKFGKYIMLALRVLPNDSNDFGGELGYTDIMQEFPDKLADKKVFVQFLVSMNTEIIRMIDARPSMQKTKKMINCVKIKYFRKALLEISFTITDEEYNMILTHPRFLYKKSEK